MSGRMIDHYRVVRQLGCGGMGEVLLAEDTTLERSVAIKLMSADLAKDANKRKRFQTEAKAASALSHPNICVIYEVGETNDGRPFLAMEYIEGRTLDELMKQRKFSLREILTIGAQAAEALDAAHSRRIVHRDIKPGNIMLDRRGAVKVLDFGLAKRLDAEALKNSQALSAALTETGILIGTPYYMSPEQVLGRELDHRSDIFSLGVVLYELVAGQRPFLGKTVGETINNVVNQQPAPLNLEGPAFAAAFEALILKCLQKEPPNRYDSATALATELNRLKQESDRSPTAIGRSETPDEGTPQPAESRTKTTQQLQLAGVTGGETPPSTSRPRAKRGLIIGAALAVSLLAIIGWIFYFSPTSSKTGSGQHPSGSAPSRVQPKSIAVLPFDNFSPEKDTDYLSDGMTDELTTSLSQVPGLKVVSRNSAFQFKGQKTDSRTIATALGVATLLEGSLSKSGSKVRVTAQLINAADGFHLWSETYDGSMEELIAVQEDITRRIAERLHAASAPAKRPAVAPEAHKLYLQGRVFWNKRTEAGLRRAIELFQQAIELDPTYAAAHAALASSYMLLPQYSDGLRASQYRPLVRASANRALELDSACAEAHAVLAMLLNHEREHQRAEEHFHRALQADPNYATGHHWYGLCLTLSNRREQGLVELQKALELDPLSPIIHTTIPEWHYFGRDYDRAIAESRKVIETFPDFSAVRLLLTAVLMRQGQFQEALAEIEKGRALQPQQQLYLLPHKGFCLARTGREAEARRILADLEQLRQQGKAVEGGMALIHQGLREFDKVMELAEQIRLTEGIDEEVLIEPMLDEMRELPQFRAFLQRAGLTNAPPAP